MQMSFNHEIITFLYFTRVSERRQTKDVVLELVCSFSLKNRNWTLGKLRCDCYQSQFMSDQLEIIPSTLYNFPNLDSISVDWTKTF